MFLIRLIIMAGHNLNSFITAYNRALGNDVVRSRTIDNSFSKFEVGLLFFVTAGTFIPWSSFVHTSCQYLPSRGADKTGTR